MHEDMKKIITEKYNNIIFNFIVNRSLKNQTNIVFKDKKQPFNGIMKYIYFC